MIKTAESRRTGVRSPLVDVARSVLLVVAVGLTLISAALLVKHASAGSTALGPCQRGFAAVHGGGTTLPHTSPSLQSLGLAQKDGGIWAELESGLRGIESVEWQRIWRAENDACRSAVRSAFGEGAAAAVGAAIVLFGRHRLRIRAVGEESTVDEPVR